MKILNEIMLLMSLCVLLFNGCRQKPIDGGARHPCPVYPNFDSSPSWSPDGSTIAYYHRHITRIDTLGGYCVNWDSTGIWLVNVDGSNPQMFLNLKEKIIGYPEWSPDGKWLVFVKDGRIWKIKANGDSLIQLTFGGLTLSPRWSPDGKKIVYEETFSTTIGILIMDADGYNRRHILDGCDPDWSPDGTKIVYVGVRGDGIYVADTNGTNIKCIFPSQRFSIETPVWSPDGSKIAFSFSGGCAGGILQVWVINADGSNARQLTTKGGIDPAWSPDGRKIVYCQYDGRVYNPKENGTLWIMDANGANKRQLTFGLGGSK